MKTTSQRGVALVVSLIMLGLVTMLAIAFIALTRRERHSVEVTKKTTEAKMMADASLARAQTEVMERLRNNINLQLLVSTNGVPPADPRPPVVYSVNGQPDDRFFLNLNRDSGPSGLPQFQPTTASQVGDPQWIGVLEDPTQPHSADNRYIGRYAYMVVPASKALDLNRIHNGATYQRASGALDAELNLAGTLGQLDGVVWPYSSYLQNVTPPERVAWADAWGLLSYRQASPWVKDVHDLLTLPGAYAPFSTRLKAATTNNPYAFYKMAATLTTASFPPTAQKFNLNNPGNLPAQVYFREVADRLLQGSLVSSVTGAVTNYYVGAAVPGNEVGSSATGFNPATFTSTNITIYPINQYKPEVHRLLQLAANLYEVVNPDPPVFFVAANGVTNQLQFPSVFRPAFGADNMGRVFINGYVSEMNNAFLGYRTLNLPADLSSVNTYANNSLMGAISYPSGEGLDLPLIIGARRIGPTLGRSLFPNFNELVHQMVFTSDFTPPSPPTTPARAVMALNARVWLETWNSTWSTTLFNAQLPFRLDVACDLRGSGAVDNQGVVTPLNFNFTLPLSTTFTNQQAFLSYPFDFPIWAQTNIGPGANSRPRLAFQLTNRVSYALSFGNRLVDHVNLFGVQSYGPRTMPANNRELEERAWQVNDPLVNSWSRDLVQTNYNPRGSLKTSPAPVPPNISQSNPTYSPWMGNAQEIGFKDVGVSAASLWNFPVGPLGNLGQIGQVHRGTPWQSVYFKSFPSGVAWPFSPDSHPTNDWRLADLFTVTSTANQSLLSVNQTNDTAWAAVLAPISLATPPEDRLNAGTHSYVRFMIPAPYLPGGHARTLYFRQDNLPPFAAGRNVYNGPGGCVNTVSGGPVNYTLNHFNPQYPTYPPPTYNRVDVATNFTATGQVLANVNLVKTLTDGINAHRTATLTNAPFASAGRLLGTPELTWNFPSAFTANWSGDADLERVPAQILSLLKADDEPAVVVYAWGQSLKPEEKSVTTSGANVGLVGNYVVSGQVGTRTIFRVKYSPPANPGQPPRMVVESFKALP